MDKEEENPIEKKYYDEDGNFAWNAESSGSDSGSDEKEA